MMINKKALVVAGLSLVISACSTLMNPLMIFIKIIKLR